MTTTSGEVRTRPFQRLSDRMLCTKQHLELSDAAYRLLKVYLQKIGQKGESINKSLGQGFPSYKSLTHGVTYTPAALGFSTRQNYELALISSYSDFSEFLEGTLQELFLTKPLLVAGKASKDATLKFHEIVKLGSWEAVTEKIIAQAFRKLEQQQSTPKLIDDVLEGTDIALDAELKNRALAFLELRHLYVHAQGKADEEYVRKYGNVIASKSKTKVKLNLKILVDGMNAVEELASVVSIELLRKGLALPATSTMDAAYRKLLKESGADAQLPLNVTPRARPQRNEEYIDQVTWRAAVREEVRDE